ncbi:MAG TPA: hypothetical protein VFI15_01865 [Candidatus Limnocylindrales bacterium]|nr:hypothetical protein [Candidatus Limnocylindrales bacterium]
MTVHAWDRGLATQRVVAVPAVAPTRAEAVGGAGDLVGRVLELQRLAGNRAVRSALASVQRAPGDDKRAAPPPPDVIAGADPAAPKHVTGFVGLNPGATREAAGLKKASKQEVLTSFNDPAMEKQLQEDPAIGEFITKELGWGPSDLVRVMNAMLMFKAADKNFREQLAELMRWMNRAEKGQLIIDRLVMSGHSDGVRLWGESQEADESKPGIMVVDRDLGGLARLFPKAAAQVQDIMFSACFSINAVEIVKKAFPNLQSVWSYGGYSPSADQGSVGHIATWAGATEGARTPTKGEKRGSNALWTREKGFIVGDPAQAAAGPLLAEVSRGGRELVAPYYFGEHEVDRAVLDSFYTKLQEVEAHPGVRREVKENVTTHVIPIVLRLRHWKQIAKRFGETFGDRLKPAYDALGVAPPNWETLTRTQLKRHLEAIDKAFETHPAAAQYKGLIDDPLKKGLFKLDSEIIKPNWI